MRRWFENAIAGLGWTPATFWDATIAEFVMAAAGHNRMNRGGSEPMTRQELRNLIGDDRPSSSIKGQPGSMTFGRSKR